VLLLNADFVNLIYLVSVADNELTLVYQNKNFKSILKAGRHVIWKGLSTYEFLTVDISKIEIDNTIDRYLFEKGALFNFIRVYKIEAYEKGIMLIDGKFDRILEAGTYLYWKNNTTIDVLKADLRQLNMEIVGQEILTKDKAQLRVNFTIQYKVTDVMKALLMNKDFEKQLYVIMQLALRATVGLLTFDELMESKEKIGASV
ncbi:MAG: slipin family protein, partial [Flavobacterium sp.]